LAPSEFWTEELIPVADTVNTSMDAVSTGIDQQRGRYLEPGYSPSPEPSEPLKPPEPLKLMIPAHPTHFSG